jgi:SAM-dependent methyltransferase
MDECLCGSTSGGFFEARETLFEKEGVYKYQICANCGSARLIGSSPTAQSGLYGDNYGTLRASAARTVVRCFTNALAYKNARIGETLGTILPFVNHGALGVVRACEASQDSWLLDVGCGSGRFLRSLRFAGFRGYCVGVDPFLRGDRVLPGGIRLIQGEIGDVHGRFDIITIVHVLEHSNDPVNMLRLARERLRDGGTIVVTIPLFGGMAWRLYGRDWVQLDAPRHVYLHTRASLGIAASAADLRIEREIHDSTVFQFWGSDVVKRRGYLFPLQGRDLALLCRRLGVYLREVAIAKREGLGDQGTFVLKASLS